MDLRKFTSSRGAFGLALLAARVLPPSLVLAWGEFIVDRFIIRSHSGLVQAIRANQWVAHDCRLSRVELDKSVREVLRHVVRCTTDLYCNIRSPEVLKALSPLTPDAMRLIQRSKERSEGALVAIPHSSCFDLALMASAYRGLDAQVLTHPPIFGSYRIQNMLRAKAGLEVTPLSKPVICNSVERLKSGGIVVTAIDRPMLHAKEPVTFFGLPSFLPTGYVRMALTAHVPVIVAITRMLPDGKYHLLASDPITMQSYDSWDITLRRNAETILEIMASFIRQAPHQWLMSYPVWPTIVGRWSTRRIVAI